MYCAFYCFLYIRQPKYRRRNSFRVSVRLLLGNVDDCSDNSDIYLNNPDVARCPQSSWLVMLLFLIYILMTTLMLVNLLIAIFR